MGVSWFCMMCGRELKLEEDYVELYVPCPNCTVNVRILLCRECARKLREEIDRQLKQS